MTRMLLTGQNQLMVAGAALHPGDAELLGFMAFLGRNVEMALRAHRALLRDLLEARRDPNTALARAGRASRRCVRAFDDALKQLRRARVPSAASECAFELTRWLDVHLEACDHLSRAAAVADPEDLRRAIACLSAGTGAAHRFNDARQRLLRQIAGAAS